MTAATLPEGLTDPVYGGVMPAASSLREPERYFYDWATGNSEGASGPVVNEITALNYLAVFSCVSLIAGAIAGLPLGVYRRQDRARVEAVDHPTYALLHDEFNPDMSAMIAREASIAHLLTWGNSFTQIVTKRNGDVEQLRPIAPDIVRVRRRDANGARGPLVYDIKNRQTGQFELTLPAEEVLHIPGLGFDGLIGYSPIRVAKTAIRAGMAQDRESERFITAGFRPPGAIKLPAGKRFQTTADGQTFRKRFEEVHNTEGGNIKVLILEDGADWATLGVDPKDAQVLESRSFSRGEICGLYRVPPHLIGDVEKSTSWGTGIEEQGANFVKYTLLNWIRRTEQEYNRKLYEKGSGLYCKHSVEGLLRGDLLKRSQALEVQHRRGIITDNEWRELEDRNPVEGGDVRHFPLAEGRVDEDGDDLPPPAATAPASPPSGPPSPGQNANPNDNTPPGDKPPADVAAGADDEIIDLVLAEEPDA